MKNLSGPDPKVQRLIAELEKLFEDNPSDKAIVFTEYLDTLALMQREFDKSDGLKGAYVILRGGLSPLQRKRIQKRFEEPGIRVLLATDAASEGLNLQEFCHTIIHFELPWNPNRLEQRNGRVDRYGQKKKPWIRYLYFPNSPEDEILNRLVQKIEQMQADRISTPDILGSLAVSEEISRDLVGLNPESGDVEDRKREIERKADERLDYFVKNVKPLVLPTGSPEDEIEHAADILPSPGTLVQDEISLEELVKNALGEQAFQESDKQHIYRITVPRHFRGIGVLTDYKKATFRRSIAVKTKPEQVEFITPLHPMVRAISDDARRRFVQVYPDSQGLRPRRLAARRVSDGQEPSVLFTFLGNICGGSGLLEETIIPVRVDLNGRIVADQRANRAILYDSGPAGEVVKPLLQKLYSRRFDALLTAAEKEAHGRLKERAAELGTRREEQAKALREDLKAFTEDRRREIQEKEKVAKGLVDEKKGQLLLDLGETGRKRSVFETQLAALETQVKERQEEIAKFEQVSEPEQPIALGALFLVPEGIRD